MRIASVRTRVVSAPYVRPFVISSGTSSDLVSLVVEVGTDEGLTGYGEAAPMTAYTGDTLAGVRAAVTEHVGPALLGRDPRDVAGAHTAMDTAIRGQPLAKAALDLALHDLAGLAADWPVHLLLGGRVREHVSTAWVVGLGTLDEMTAEAAAYAAKGFPHIKVKGGVDPAADIELVRAVRAVLPAGTELSLDANEGYGPTVAARALARMAEAGLDLVEQPLPRWDLDGLAALRSKVGVRVMVDESVHSLHDALEVVRRGAADVLNIKILKVGGLHRARQIAAVAEAAGLAVKIGSMPELGVATLAAVHLAAALPHATVAADLVGPLMVREEPLAPTFFAAADRGRVRVPTAPGLGHDLG
ncbi:mandelate racemase/muconate lactonizing enzyme family protein [Streptomyces sp. CMB-StM0423]|uniref:mandelate racemase/muconate lactonizing enzyme family protein n=1 Tax=Streptomyces sp. CMB-StM0423 TaxID=2059884 RepID=UPI000C7064F4|nr:enolase C-terminal domain-like protein [Streptomyces sp. CMB-StM0423]AUH41418.1 mandelate racemase/muconate lactonizing protein [Streptomyces sp. CMB-StM0423]